MYQKITGYKRNKYFINLYSYCIRLQLNTSSLGNIYIGVLSDYCTNTVGSTKCHVNYEQLGIKYFVSKI